MVRSMGGSDGGRAGWVFGPAPDLLFGCGGLYVCVLLAFVVGGAGLREAEAVWLGPLLVLIVGAPHYGATILRVYEHRADRRAYVLFSLYATLAIAAAFVVALWDRRVAIVLVTLYLTWSPWHYTGQNYGLAVMFLRRGGVSISPAPKRLLYASFLLSFAMTVLIFHGIDSAPDPEFASGPSDLFASIGIPRSVTDVAFPLCFAGSLLTLAAAGVLFWRQGASLRALAPAAAMTALQGVWFTLPFAIRHWNVGVEAEPLRWSLRTYYFFWIAVGHSAQYIWITSYYARRSEHWPGRGGAVRYFAKILVAGTAVWTLPVILFDPSRIGMLPNTAGLSLLVASAVNLHHFVLDGAIWKLRQGRIADVLVRRPRAAEALAAPAPERGLLRRLVWTIGVLASALAFFRYVHQDLLFPTALERRDFAAARAALDRLGWVSAVNEDAARQIDAQAHADARRREASERRVERQLGVIPPVDAYLQRGAELAAAGEWEAAAEAFESGLQLDPTHGGLLRGAAAAWLECGEPERAAEIYRRALELHPWDAESRNGLRRARRRIEAQQRTVD